MKTRQLVRKHGWTPVDVDAEHIDRLYMPSVYKTIVEEDNRNKLQYQEILDWCNRTAGPENFVSALQHGGAWHNRKRFIFKHAKHATMFRLKWLT